MSDLSKLLAPMARRIGNMLSRGTIAAVNAASKMQGLQIRLLAGEVKDNIEHFEPYGFTSNPNPGAEVIAAFFDGDRSHGIVVVAADRRFRIQGLATGEMAIHDDQGQKVHLTRTGILIHTAFKCRIEAENIELHAEQKCRIEATDIELHASKSYSWDTHGYGERWTWLSGTTWEHKTWQTGATVTAVPLSIKLPEGP